MKAWHFAVAATLVGVAWFGSHAARTTGEPARAAPRTRIALVNMTYVMKYYPKFAAYQNELKKVLEPFQVTDKDLRAKADKIAKEVNDPSTPANDREKLSEELKKIKHAIEENSQEAKTILSKRGDEHMTALYMAVVSAASRYARAHDFELVLHYNDVITREDFQSPANIGRKLQNGALTPLYAAPGLDISKEVVENLIKAGGREAPSGGDDVPVEKKE
jgi:Skp family chaperone for outer membrane proteins